MQKDYACHHKIACIAHTTDDEMFLSSLTKNGSPDAITFDFCDFDSRSGSTDADKIESQNPDVVLLFHSASTEGTIETIKNIHDRLPHLPVVVLGTADDEKLIVQVLDAGGQDYLIKSETNSILLRRSINCAIKRQRIAASLTSAVSAARLGLWDWNVQTNELRLDDGMFRLLGIQRSDKNSSLREFLQCVHSEDRGSVKELFNKQGTFDLDFRLTSANDRIRHVQMKGEVFCDFNGIPQRMSGICSDITGRKDAEEALRVSEETLSLALESSAMGVWEYSVENRSISRSMLHDGIFGATEKIPQWTVKIFMQYVHLEDREFVSNELNKGVVEGSLDFSCRIARMGDGEIRWVTIQAKRSLDSQGKARFIGTIRDITDEKILELLAEEATERSNQLLQAVVQHAPIGIAILDTTMKIVSTNAVFEQMIGKEAASLIGSKVDHVLPYIEVKSACPAVANGQPAQISRLLVSDADKQEKFWDLSLWPVKISNKMTGAVLKLNDRTHTVLLERQRDDFVAAMAHDIKNPLIGAARLLEVLCTETDKTSPSGHAPYLVALKESTQDLLSLVQNLVDVYRYESLTYPCHLEKISSSSLIESCVKQTNFFAESRGVQVHSTIEGGAEVMEADAIGIRRVLMNLLHNAVKFNKQGGHVEIVAKRKARNIIIEVCDEGRGMTKPEQAKLFMRFSQGAEGKNCAAGSGLGLYLSKQIVAAHHGSITCKSTAGAGSTFCVELPCAHTSRSNQRTICSDEHVQLISQTNFR